MTTKTAAQFAGIRAELKFIGREVSNMSTADFETVDAIMHALSDIETSIFEIELDAQPSMENDLLAA
jgi:hypothetical protein